MLRFVVVACAALLFVPPYMKGRSARVVPGLTAFSALSSGRISVKVSGDVACPGIYEVGANVMAENVMKLADPHRPIKLHITDKAANSPLRHGSSLQLLLQPDGSLKATVGQMTVPERLVLRIPLDITTMTEADLDRLPGIGPALARRIAEYRQNNGGILRVSDLVAIEGIGEKKYKEICRYFQAPVNIE